MTAIALNGAGVVHDFEVAVAGRTSEDVEAGLGTGAFGMARETGEEVNRAIVEGDRDGLGLGAAVGRYLSTRRPRAAPPRREPARRGVAARPARDRARRDRHRHRARAPGLRPRRRSAARPTSTSGLFAGEVARLGGGGVYLNVGSAVVLPEVFLKAVTLARNLGHRLVGLRHRQPRLPPVLPARRERGGAAGRGHGRGYRLTGHHEILVPLLAAALVEKAGRRGRRR